MALKKQDEKKTAGQADLPKADGWLHIKVKGADGNLYTVGKGVPLYLTNQADRSLINATKAAGEEGRSFEFVGSVYIPQSDEEKAKDIPL
ncbi:MAG: hypothetical protein CMC55_08590 [Flavobacteriaceae bacterium]|nr:hypothetical protein [Flavobacteriaceae bacterium]|tara:strand:- start:60 stop:329 length:270 start_codon:yes stop_codon:yes gene_type:complete